MTTQAELIKECEECYEQMIISLLNPIKEETESFVLFKMRSCKFAPYGCAVIEKVTVNGSCFCSNPQS